MRPRLAAEGLSRVFPSGDGVHEASISVAPGEIHALVGLNGAGKSTLMRMLLGMTPPATGTIEIDGVSVRYAPARLWARVGHLVEHPLIYPELTVAANLTVAARLRGVSRRTAGTLARSAITEFGLSAYQTRKSRLLSLGNRQRVGLAAALQHDPQLIILDEPTNALDPAGVLLLREILLRRARSQGAGILVSSHHLDEVARVADRITVMNRGRLIGSLDPGTVDIERAFFGLVYADSAPR